MSPIPKLEVSSANESKPASHAADYGVILLVIPVIAALANWFWVSGANRRHIPGSEMVGLIIVVFTVFGTALVAAMEAKRVGMKSDGKLGTYGPTAWFFILLMFWAIGYPAYLFKRRHYGLANRLVAGIFITFIFMGSLV